MTRAEAAPTSAGGIRFMNQHLQDKFPQKVSEPLRVSVDRRLIARWLEASARRSSDQSRVTVIDEGDGLVAAMIGAAGVPKTIGTTNDNSAYQSSPQ